MTQMTSYRIKGPWPGDLAIIPRPRGGDWLEDEVCALKEAGFEVVVSLLTSEEAEELSLRCEAEIIRKHGLQFCNYPIPDLGVPKSLESAMEFLRTLHRDLMSGKTIAIHCRGSIGRSGLVASSILILSGIDPTQAMHQVSEARGFDAPETDEQKEWVVTLSIEPAKLIA
jgi:protein-tyrosine phosphatase